MTDAHEHDHHHDHEHSHTHGGLKHYHDEDMQSVSITLDQLPADYDVQLVNAAGTVVASSQNGSTTAESISYPVTTTGDYYIRIYGYNGATSSSTAYRLKVVVP